MMKANPDKKRERDYVLHQDKFITRITAKLKESVSSLLDVKKK